MFSFFRGWKRKLGVATLGLGCIFGAGWVRSLTIGDTLWIAGPDSLQKCESYAGKLLWEKQSPNFEEIDTVHTSFESIRWGQQVENDTYWDDRDIEWHWKFSGFDFGAGTLLIKELGRTFRHERWKIPYWSIVLPLTAVSAWLLLSKRPPLKPVESAKTQP
jgi:hypothetical protein